jgi:hypothetical protein
MDCPGENSKNLGETGENMIKINKMNGLGGKSASHGQ